jgi:hypothetical protein
MPHRRCPEQDGTTCACIGFLSRIASMQRFYATAALLTVLALIASQDGQVLAASPSTTQTPEQTVPQGTDPPGSDDDVQSSPTTKHKGMITPPKTGDEASTLKRRTLMPGPRRRLSFRQVRRGASIRTSSRVDSPRERLAEVRAYPAGPR